MARDSDLAVCFDTLIASSRLKRADARLLLEVACGRPREWLIAHGDESPPDAVAIEYKRLEAERLAGTPLAYLTGEREFYGLRLSVTPAVLIPRIETEMLVALVVENTPQNSSILELGTGSGAIAIAIAIERPDLQVTATDVSEQAIVVAQSNACRLGARVRFLTGSWWGAVARHDKFASIVSNPPYLALNDEHLALGDLRFEPQIALASGPAGLNAIEAIISGVQNHLVPGGRLFIEHGWQQAGAVQAVMARAELEEVRTLQDDQGHWRVTMARTPQPKTVV